MSKNIVNKVLNSVKEHSPEILVSAGIVGMASSAVLAVKATPKAMRLLEDKKADIGDTN